MKTTTLLASALFYMLASTLTLRGQTFGDRYVWLMNGSGSVSSSVNIGFIDPSWHVAAIGSFHSGGTNDLVWENLQSGDRIIWLMSGTTVTGRAFLGNVSTDWRIVGAADFDGCASYLMTDIFPR
jgi:hypothetical protein